MSNDQHYLTAIRQRLEILYEEHPNDAKLREHISDEVDWINDQLNPAIVTPDGAREALEKIVARLGGPSNGQFWDIRKIAVKALAAIPPSDSPGSAHQPQGGDAREGDYYLVPREIIDQFPEINASNYDHDDACALNAWGCEVVTNSNPALVRAAAEPGEMREAIPKVSLIDDELLIEWGRPDVVISVDDDGFGYAVRRGNQFEPGISKKWSGAVTEIRDAIAALSPASANEGERTMSELLNCPFCGSRCVTLLNGGPGNHYVRCDDCLASSNDVGRDRAVEPWNRRTLAPAQDTGRAAPGYRTSMVYGDGYKDAIEDCARIAARHNGVSPRDARDIAKKIRALSTPSTERSPPSASSPADSALSQRLPE